MNAYCLVVLLAVAGAVWGQPQGPDILWTKYYGDTTGTSSSRLRVVALRSNRFANGDILFVAMEYRYSPEWRGTSLRRVDSLGNTMWYRLFNLHIENCCVTNNESIMGIGWTPGLSYAYPQIVKMNAQGDTLWTRSYIYNDLSNGEDIQEVENGGFVIAGVWQGNSLSHPQGIYIMRINSEGDTLWTRYYSRGISPSDPCNVQGVRLYRCSAGGYLVKHFGSCVSTPHPLGFYIMRIDEQGDSLWARHYQPPTQDEYSTASLADVCETPDGGFLLVGPWDATDGYAIRINSEGDTLWTRVYGWMQLNSVTPDPRGGYILAARDDPEYYCQGYLMKVNETGIPMWLTDVGPAELGGAQGNMRPQKVRISNNACTIEAMAQLIDSDMDLIALVRFTPEVSTEDIYTPAVPGGFWLNDPYPNPFNSTTTLSFSLSHTSPVSLTIFNLLGQNVYEENLGLLNAGEHRQLFDANDLPSGVYLARVQAGEHSQMRKIVLLR